MQRGAKLDELDQKSEKLQGRLIAELLCGCYLLMNTYLESTQISCVLRMRGRGWVGVGVRLRLGLGLEFRECQPLSKRCQRSSLVDTPEI